MTCFEGSPCIWEGVGVEVEEKDTTKMFCGSDYENAMTCSTPCPSGMSSDCPTGSECFSDVECGSEMSSSESNSMSNPFEEITVEVDMTPLEAEQSSTAMDKTEAETASSVSNMFVEVTMDDVEPEAQALEASSEPVPSSSSELTSSSTESLPEPAAAGGNSETLPESPTSSEEAAPSNTVVNPFEKPSSSEPMIGLQAKNIRMAIYGLNELGSHHIQAWEILAAEYVEAFFNEFSDSSSDIIRAAVSDVATVYEVTDVSLSSSRRGLRSSQRRAGGMTAFLLEYTQTTRYMSERDTKIGEVLQHPFNSPTKRASFVKYLQDNSDLFGGLSYVSAIFLPQKFEAAVDTSSPEAAAYDPTYESFYCHNSGEACPSGQCVDGDLCLFMPGRSDPIVPIAPYVAPAQGTSEASQSWASEILSSALNGDLPSQDTLATEQIEAHSEPVVPQIEQAQPIGTVAVDNLPYSNAAYGPTTVTGEMTLEGMQLVEVDHIYEWQYTTSVYEQEFYNTDPPTNDYVKNSVYDFATVIKMIDVKYSGDDTIIKFEQTIKYNTVDASIPSSAIVTQPFLTPEYREGYITYLKTMLPQFESLSSTSSVQDDALQANEVDVAAMLAKLTESFYCAEAWPLDCQTAVKCENGDGCPHGQKCFAAPSCVAEEVSPQQQTESTAWVGNDATETTTSVSELSQHEAVTTSFPPTSSVSDASDLNMSEVMAQVTTEPPVPESTIASVNQQYSSTVAAVPSATTESPLSLDDLEESIVSDEQELLPTQQNATSYSYGAFNSGANAAQFFDRSSAAEAGQPNQQQPQYEHPDWFAGYWSTASLESSPSSIRTASLVASLVLSSSLWLTML